MQESAKRASMKKTIYIAAILLCQIQTSNTQGLLGNFMDFFEVNSPVAGGNDTGFPTDGGFPPSDGFPPDSGFPTDSGFPPDPGFPADTGFPPDPGFPQDSGSAVDTGFPSDNGFPPGEPAVLGPVDTSNTGNIGTSSEPVKPTGSDAAITKTKPTSTGMLPPGDFGLPSGQTIPVDNSGNDLNTNLGGGLPAIPVGVGVGAGPTDVDPFSNTNLGGGLPAIPVGVGVGIGPADVDPFSVPVDSGLPASVGVPIEPMPVGPTPVDVTASGSEIVVGPGAGAVFPPFDVSPADQQPGAGGQGLQVDQQDPLKLDFHFLPRIPSGGNFVDLVTGSTGTFTPSIGWLGNPGKPVDIELNGPPASGPVNPIPAVDIPFVDENAVTIPVVDPVQPAGPQPLPVPVTPVKPIETKPPVNVDPFVDPLTTFDPKPSVDVAPAANVPDPNTFDRQNVLPGSSSVLGGLGTSVVIGSNTPASKPGNKPGIVSLFDISAIGDPTQSLGNGKPAVLPFNPIGPANPKPVDVPSKNKVPDSWMTLYPSGRRPNRPVVAKPTPVANANDANQESAAERILYDLSLGSFGRNRDLQKQLRNRRKQSRQQRRRQRQLARQRGMGRQAWRQSNRQATVVERGRSNPNRQSSRARGRSNPSRRSRGGRVARISVPSPTENTSRHIARMVLPGTNQPFIGKRIQRGKRSALCPGNQILCLDGAAYSNSLAIKSKMTVRKRRAANAIARRRQRQRQRARQQEQSNGFAFRNRMRLKLLAARKKSANKPIDADNIPVAGGGQQEPPIEVISQQEHPSQMITSPNIGIEPQPQMDDNKKKGKNKQRKQRRQNKKLEKRRNDKMRSPGRQAAVMQAVDLSQFVNSSPVSDLGSINPDQGQELAPFVSSQNVFINPSLTQTGLPAVPQPVVNKPNNPSIPFVSQHEVFTDQSTHLQEPLTTMDNTNTLPQVLPPFVSSQNVFADPSSMQSLSGETGPLLLGPAPLPSLQNQNDFLGTNIDPATIGLNVGTAITDPNFDPSGIDNIQGQPPVKQLGAPVNVDMSLPTGIVGQTNYEGRQPNSDLGLPADQVGWNTPKSAEPLGDLSSLVSEPNIVGISHISNTGPMVAGPDLSGVNPGPIDYEGRTPGSGSTASDSSLQGFTAATGVSNTGQILTDPSGNVILNDPSFNMPLSGPFIDNQSGMNSIETLPQDLNSPPAAFTASGQVINDPSVPFKRFRKRRNRLNRNRKRRIQKLNRLKGKKKGRNAGGKRRQPKLAKKMETVQIVDQAAVAEPEPPTPTAEMDCIAGLGCIDWSWEGK